MPIREIGIRGYVGEAIVEQWLQKIRYPDGSYQIVNQILPAKYPKAGGPYLDLGVVKDGIVEAVYEVKSQDYIIDQGFHINGALRYVWDHKGQAEEYVTQDGECYVGSNNLQGYLVVMVGPNEGGMENIGKANLKNVILFQEIMNELDRKLDVDRIHGHMKQDLIKSIDRFRCPNSGKQINEAFLKKKAVRKY